jgi:hypothetical protein
MFFAKRAFLIIVIATVFFTNAFFHAGAQQKIQIPLNAFISNSNGTSITDGTYEIRFALYSKDRQTSDPYPSNTDQKVWEETLEVNIFGGVLNTELGNTKPFPSDINFTQTQYFLGVRIGNDAEMAPRKKVSPDLLALDSYKLNGKTTGSAANNIPVINASGKLDAALIPNLTTIGTISTGTWEGDVIADAYISNTLTNKTVNNVFLKTDGTIRNLNLSADVSLDQNLSISSSPTFASLNLANQLSILSGGTNSTTLGEAGTLAYSDGTKYAFSAQGTSGQVLLSGGNAAPVWGTVGGGIIAANSIDLSELKDTLTLDNNLTIQNTIPNTYNVSFGADVLPSQSDTYNLGSMTKRWGGIYASSLTINGQATLGTSGQNVTINSNLIPSTGGLNLGSSTNHWANLFVDNMSVGGTNVNGTSSQYFTINTDANTETNMGIRFYKGTTNDYAALSWDPVAHGFKLYAREDNGILAKLSLSSLNANSLILSANNAATLQSYTGYNGYVNFSGGIGTGGSDSISNALRLTSSGNLVNIGSIQGGEMLLTKAGTFAAKVDYGVSLSSFAVTSADLNGDGMPDIATANDASPSISVLLNNGNGTFATKVDYTTGITPTSIAAGDFNGDGKNDLVAGNFSSSTISVFLNNGDGTFATKVDYASGTYPDAVTTGDMNSDGRIDIVTANGDTGNVSVFLNNGNGTFATKVDYAVGSWPTGVAVGDLNGDGKVDIVSSNGGTTTLSVLLNNGDGTFANKVDYTIGTGPTSVVIADFNGDGKNDVIGGGGSGNISVFLNTGNGTLASKVDYAAGSNVRSLAAGDFNGDGKNDIAAGRDSAARVTVFMNNGDGTFATKVDYVPTSTTKSLCIADFNGDGKNDIASANSWSSSVSVFLNTTSSMFYAQASTGRVGIGTSSPQFPLHVKAIGVNDYDQVPVMGFESNGMSLLYGDSYSNTNFASSIVRLRRSRGTSLSPTTILAGDALARFSANGYDGTTFQEAALIRMGVPFSRTSGMPGVINFYTTPDGSNSVLERMIIDQNGYIGIGTTSPGNMLTIGGYNSAVLNTFKQSLLSVDNMQLSQLEGGAYFGRVGIKEQQLALNNYANIWVAKDSARQWYGIAMNSDGKIQTAITDNGIYLSTDYGNIWTVKIGGSWTGVAMSSDGKIQTATVGGGQIYVSTDYGSTWVAKDSSRSWGSVAMSSDGKIQTAAVGGGQIYVSTDYGNIWTAKESSRTWSRIAMSSDGKIQTAVIRDGQIYASYDYGNTWVEKFASIKDWRGVAMNSDGKIQTAVVYGEGAWVSIDYGNTWNQKVVGNFNNVAMSSDGKIQTIAVAAGLLVYSVDYGNTWGTKASSKNWKNIAMSSDGKIQTAVALGAQIYVSHADSYLPGGNFGIGTASPASLLSVGATSQFQVDTNGAIAAIAGYTQTAGNFAMSGVGTFATGTGTVSLNGATTIAANQNFSMASGTGTYLQTYTGTATANSIIANSLTTGTGFSLSTSSASLNSTNGLLYVANTGASTNGILARFQSNSTAGSGMTILANGNVGIGTSSPSYKLDVSGVTRTTDLIAQNLTLSSSNTSLLQATIGYKGYTNFSGGIGTGGSDSLSAIQRLTSEGNLTNIGSIQAGEMLLTKAGTFAAKADYTTGVNTNPEGIASGDLNGDGKPDLAVPNFMTNTVSVFLNNGNGTFAAKVDYATGTNPMGVAIGDLNGDGKADMVVSNYNGGNISVYINNGNGTFAAGVTYSTSGQPTGVAIGDVNGDGKSDVVVTNSSSNLVSIFINNGNGTLATKVDYTTGSGSSPQNVAIGDFNGDGKADLATANFGGSGVSVFLNNGSGTFAAKVDYTAGSGTYGVAAGDLNGDGKIDLAAVNYNANNMSVFINNGNGTFAAKVDYNTGTGAMNVAMGDLNGDGKIDVATANYGAGALSVSVFVNNGNGIFATKVDYTTAGTTSGVNLVDLNGDGKLDIAASAYNTSNVSVLLNTTSTMFYAQASTGNIGIGTSTPYGKLNIASSPSASANYGTLSLGGAAFDGVATGKFVGSASGTSLAINEASTYTGNLIDAQLAGVSKFKVDYTGALTTAGNIYVSTIAPASNNSGMSIQFRSTNSAADMLALSSGTYTNATGTLSAVKIMPTYNQTAATGTNYDLWINRTETSVSTGVQRLISAGTGGGTYVEKFGVSSKGDAYLAGALNSQGLIINASNANNIQGFVGYKGYTNFSGGIGTGGSDSLNSIQRLTSEGNLTNIGSIQAGEMLLTKAGTFAAKVDYTSGSIPQSVAIGDLNGDGKADIAVANKGSNTVSVFLNNGNGTFATKVDYTTGSLPYSVAIGDLNGDGKGDLAVANFSGFSISVFINNGNGTFAAKVDYATTSSAGGVTMGDLNGDGKLDLVAPSSSVASVYINKGNGTFAAKVDYATGTGAASAAIADFNGDGRADLAVANGTGNSVSVLLNNGGGTFAAKVDYAAGGSWPLSIVAGDFNGDGKEDIATISQGADTVSVFLNNGNGTFAAKVDYATGSAPTGMAIGDLNGDGKADIITANQGASNASVLINNGNGTFATKVDYAAGALPQWVAIGDLNGDGKMDFAVANNNPAVSVFLNTTSPMLYAQASTGNVGIGTVAPSAQLHTTGTVRFASLGSAGANLTTDANGNVTASSDERLKNIAGTFNKGVEALMNISPIAYHWNTQSGLDTKNTYYGFSAQNIQASIPEAVGVDSRGMLTLSDRPILATVVNAIKEQQTQLNSISNEFSSIKSENIKTLADLQLALGDQFNKITTQFANIDSKFINLEKTQADSQQILSNLQTQIDQIKTLTASTQIELLTAKTDLNEADISLLKQVLGITQESGVNVTLAGSLTANGINTPSITIVSNDPLAKSAGTATIKIGETFITIETKTVKTTSKIYITPVGSTGNNVLYVGNVIDGKSFEIKMDNVAQNDVVSNWLIVQEEN